MVVPKYLVSENIMECPKTKGSPKNIVTEIMVSLNIELILRLVLFIQLSKTSYFITWEDKPDHKCHKVT